MKSSVDFFSNQEREHIYYSIRLSISLTNKILSKKLKYSSYSDRQRTDSSLKCETSFYIQTEQKRSIAIVIEIVKSYIKNYNKKRIQQKLGYLSPFNTESKQPNYEVFLFIF